MAAKRLLLKSAWKRKYDAKPQSRKENGERELTPSR
jgi:hypothetical protein